MNGLYEIRNKIAGWLVKNFRFAREHQKMIVVGASLVLLLVIVLPPYPLP